MLPSVADAARRGDERQAPRRGRRRRRRSSPTSSARARRDRRRPSTSASSRDVLAEVATRFHDVALVATREAERRAELAALAPAGARRAVARLRRQRPRRPDGRSSITCARLTLQLQRSWQTPRPMASLAALVRDNTTLDRDQVSHLNRLMSEWGMLADFCFADLLLYVPTKDDRWLIVGQVRPATGQTVYHTDWVGTFANVSERSVLSSSLHVGRDHRGRRRASRTLPDSARMLAVPVRCDGRPIAVLTREWVQRAGRPPGELERTYVSIFDRFAGMIAEGSFPYPARGADSTAAPRVGDGVMSLDADGRVTLPVAERQLGAAPRRHPRQRRRDAPRRARLPRRHGAQGVRAPRADRRGVRAGAPTSRCCAAACRSSPAARSPAACCSCATSPTCASATGC